MFSDRATKYWLVSFGEGEQPQNLFCDISSHRVVIAVANPKTHLICDVG